VKDGADQSLFETERFVLREVLQLICARAQALTAADCVLVALREGTELVCRAAAGVPPLPQGIPLNGESGFLRGCLESGRILRCDDTEADERMRADFARQLGARSAVVVPLCGRRERLGVLQAFATTPWAFTDQDIRCFDLFAELVLAALKPADQDRRLHWLSDVAGELLQGNAAAVETPAPATGIEVNIADRGTTPETAAMSAVIEPVVAETAAEPAIVIPTTTAAAPITTESITQPIAPGVVIDAAPDTEPETAPIAAETTEPELVAATRVELAPIEAATTFEPQGVEFEPAKSEVGRAELNGNSAVAQHVSVIAPAAISATATDLAALTQPVVIPVAMFELPGPELDEVELPTYLTFEKGQTATASAVENTPEAHRRPSFLQSLAVPFASRPGLSVVLMLVMVAGLFSAGVWWGMQAHTRTPAQIAGAPRSVTAPPAPAALAPNVTDAAAPLIAQDMPPTPVADDKLAALPKVTAVRHWSSSMGSTVVIDMEDQVNYEVHRLMAPERIYFDLHDTALPPELDGKTMDVGDTSLTRVRVAQPVAGVTRVVLDTKDGSNFSVSMETNPYRLVVELRDNTKSVASSRIVPAAPAAKPATTASLAAASTPASQPIGPRTGKFRIVLDAGHGGWDLGTVGRKGLLEKDLVLDVAERLGKLLKSRMGAEVLFTRTGDEYVALDQRADFANQAQADLFVSVHANYSSSTTARGVETYYTNLFSAPGSKEIDKHQDGTFTPPSLVSLSADGLREKIDESRRLAASVQRSLYGALAVKSPDIRDRGIKDASFVVLTGTTMPSILTEISFVSSPADEHNLQSEAYRQQIAEALYKGIARYQESSPKAKVAQLRPAATGR